MTPKPFSLRSLLRGKFTGPTTDRGAYAAFEVARQRGGRPGAGLAEPDRPNPVAATNYNAAHLAEISRRLADVALVLVCPATTGHERKIPANDPRERNGRRNDQASEMKNRPLRKRKKKVHRQRVEGPIEAVAWQRRESYSSGTGPKNGIGASCRLFVGEPGSERKAIGRARVPHT